MNLYKKIVLTLILWVVSGISVVAAQQLKVEGFVKVHKPLFFPTPGRDKSGAVINYAVAERGFVFKLGGEQLATTEGDDAVSMVVPKKSSFLEISHPEYGTLYWKFPMKVKRKRVYNAALSSNNPKSEYRISKQWAVVDIDPRNAIVKVDTTMMKVRDGVLQLYLQIGDYPIHIESPFHESLSDTLRIEEAVTTRVQYELRPFYSYIEVKSPNKDATLTIDGVKLPEGEMKSGRLLVGEHTVELSKPKHYSRTVSVNVGESDRRIVEMELLPKGARRISKHLSDVDLSASQSEADVEAAEAVEVQSDTLRMVKVKLTPFDDECEVLINRESVGLGTWSGELAEGDYYFMSRRDGLESRTIYSQIDAEYPIDLKLPTPLAYYGKLSVASNVPEAKIYLNGELAGVTPLIIHNLDQDISYDVELRKAGYKSKKKRVKLRGNSLVGVELDLKNKNK